MNNWQQIKNPQLWLLGIAVSLITLHLYLTWKSNNIDLLSGSLLFWVTSIYLIWEKRDRLNLESGVLSSCLGIFIITLLLVKLTHILADDVFLRIVPLLSILGLGLLASGFKGLKQYWQPLVLFGLIAIPWQFIYLFVDLSLLTAKFSSFLLWLLGFQVFRQGVFVSLPTGSIEVYDGCSGLRLIVHLLGIALIILLVFNSSIKHKILLTTIAITIGFIINGVRVALMAVLVALGDPEAFKYWHTGDGSLIFSLVSVLILGLTYAFLVRGKNLGYLDGKNQ